MKNKWKSLLSFLVIGLFMMMALASLGPDKSTNTTVAISNCQSRPAAQGHLVITIQITDQKGESIGGSGKLFIVHQKVRSDTTCTYDVILSLVHEFTVAYNDTYTYDGPDFIHDNSEDLFRVELILRATQLSDSYAEVKVIKYAQSTINFRPKVSTYDNL